MPDRTPKEAAAAQDLADVILEHVNPSDLDDDTCQWLYQQYQGYLGPPNLSLEKGLSSFDVPPLRRWNFTRRRGKIRLVVYVSVTKVWHIPARWIHFLFRLFSRVRDRSSS